jgi:5-formyltetrahydrofolate cyclo-ligase
MAHASPASAKTVLRLALRAERKRLARETPDAGERAARHFPADRQRGSAVVAGYRPKGDEIDPRPLMNRLAQAGAALALPVASARDAALVFRAYAPGDPLEPDAFGIPAPTAQARLVRPDLVITPLLAFDRAGGRLGQGGGHYDRALQTLRSGGAVFVLGLAYAGQAVVAIPMEPHDQRLDAILTETGYIEVE